MKLSDIQKERAELEARQVQLYKRADSENRKFTVDELDEIDSTNSRIAELDEKRNEVREQEARTACAEREAEMAERSKPVVEARPVQNVNERMNQYIRGIIEGRDALTTTLGAGLIPSDLAGEVTALADRVSAVRQAAKVVNVARAMNVPRQLAYSDQSDSNESFVAEGAAYDPSDISYGVINAGTFEKKIAKVMEYTDEMAADAAFDIGQFMISNLAEQIAYQQEDQFCNGTGTAQHQGCFKTGVSGVNTYTAGVDSDALTVEKVIQAILTALPPQYMGLPRFLICNQATAAAILSDSDNGRLLLQPNAQANAANMPQYEVLGTKILISSRAPDADAAGEVGAVVMTSDSYMIQDIAGGMRIQDDPYTGASTGKRRLNASWRTSAFMVRPQSIVQIAK